MSKKTFVLGDESVNTYGFRILTDGGDLSQMERNPVMFLNHDTWPLPIGRWENIRKDGGRILADPVFDLDDPEGQKVAGKVERNFVRMASLGIIPIEWSIDPNLKLEGQEGPTLTRWIAKEASIVSMGANLNALRLYDVEGKLMDDDAVLKLMDGIGKNKQIINNQKKMNDELIKMLNLSDEATESDVHQAIKLMQSDNARLKDENETFKARIDELNEAAQQRLTAEAIRLTDEAVKDGRLNADAKAEMLEMFNLDFEKAKKVLTAIPKRVSVKDKIKDEQNLNDESYQKFVKLSWDDLDKNGQLSELRDAHPDLYEEKYEKRFGVKPRK